MASTAHITSATLRDLARLLAWWLVAVVLVQGLAAAQGLVLGRLHVHRPAKLVTQSVPALKHAHDETRRHHHDAGDRSVLPVAPEASTDAPGSASAALMALSAALATMLPSAAPWRDSEHTHVWRPAARWTASVRYLAPPERPPRG